MPRILRLSALAALSPALLTLVLSGCGQQPADGTQVEVNEVERKQAVNRMRAVMDTPRKFGNGPMSSGSRSR